MTPTERQVQLIERSLACFRWGFVGMLPLVGVPWAVKAIHSFVMVRAAGRGLWNPAESHAWIGLVLGLVGTIWFAMQMLALAGWALNHMQ
jgi:hypothetical protein